MDSPKPLEALEHHKQAEYCQTRLNYRKGKKLTAVKVYSVVSESRHLLVFGVPKVNLRSELKKLFSRMGTIENITSVTEEIIEKGYTIEPFTECFHISFKKEYQARKAKKFLDAQQFYGGVLHISYAVERETITDTKQKLANRRRDVIYRLQQQQQQQNTGSKRTVNDDISLSKVVKRHRS